MKKIVTFLLVLCLILSGCSSGTTEQATTVQTTEAAGPMTFELLQDKYKRADWEVLTSDPISFIKDFDSSDQLSKDEWAKDWSIFTFEDDKTLPSYSADIVLFNKPFEIHVWESSAKTIRGNLYYDTQDMEECFDTFKKIFESAIKELGDPTTLSVKYDEVSEADFRKALQEPLDSFSGFTAKWEGDFQFTVAIDCYIDHAILSFL